MKKITLEFLNDTQACKSGIQFWKDNGSLESPTEVIRQAATAGKYGYCRWVVEMCLDTKPEAVELAVFAAELVLPVFEAEYPEDKRPRQAVEAAKVWLVEPSEENWMAAYEARTAAWAAARAADAARAARAADAADAAADAADAAADAAAWAAYAARAADAAAYAAAEKAIWLKIADKMATFE